MARAMKDSGNDWIGYIPTSYIKYRFKNICTLYTGNSIPDDKKEIYTNSENARPYISSKDIDTRYCTVNYENGLYIKIKDNNFRVAKKNDTLMCIEGGSAGKKKAFIDREVSFVNKLCCFSGSSIINSKYLFYFLSTPSYEDEFKFHITGMIGGVSTSTLRNLDICLPPLDEQNKIVEYLDKKCEEIDAITAKIQEQITTLEEYKKSIISEAVTKGLNPNALMKEYNNQYWSIIPKNWKLSDIKYLFEIVKRIAGKEGFDILSVTQNGLKIKDISNNEGQLANNYSGYQFVYPTDYVMNHMDLLTGWVDCSNMFGVTSPDYRVFRLKDKKANNLTYYKYVFQSCYSNKIFYSLGAGVSNLGRWRLQTDAFNNFMIPVPPFEEQQEIADYLDSQCSQIEAVITNKREQIETLEEYKKTLIYEYVTGKKEIA